jgi:MFS superfamily sulfate permease-like transporter
MFKPMFTVTVNEDEYTVHVVHSAVFSNFIKLRQSLDSLPQRKKIIVDCSKAQLIDHTVMEHLKHYQEEYIHNGGQFKIAGLHQHKSLSQHELSAKVLLQKQ